MEIKEELYFNVVTGQSSDDHPGDAIEEILEQCDQKLNGATPRAGILIASIHYNREVILSAIMKRFPGLLLIGCTSYGQFSSVMGYQEESVVLTLFDTNGVSISGGVIENASKIKTEEIDRIIQTAQQQINFRGSLCLTTPTGLTINGSKLLKKLALSLRGIPLFGGYAADDFDLKQTYQFFNGKVYDDAIPFLLFDDRLKYSFGLESGWQRGTQEGIVTRSRENIVYEINHQPAYHFYTRYLSNNISSMGQYPLAVYDHSEKPYYRAVFQTDFETGTLSLAGDVPEGSRVQIADTSRSEIVVAAEHATQEALKQYPGEKPEAIFCFSCAARRRMLGTKTAREYQLMERYIPGIETLGFYCFGEIAPLSPGKASKLHNYTFVTLLIGIK